MANSLSKAERFESFYSSLMLVYEVQNIVVQIVEEEPARLYIQIQATTPTNCWTEWPLIPHVYLEPPKDGIWDFLMVAAPPPEGAIVLPMLTEYDAQYIWHMPKDWKKSVKGIRITTSTNSGVQLLADAIPAPTKPVNITPQEQGTGTGEWQALVYEMDEGYEVQSGVNLFPTKVQEVPPQ